MKYAERVAVLASVIDAIAPGHRPPRYEGSECSDENLLDRLTDDPKEYACQRCEILLAADPYELDPYELRVNIALSHHDDDDDDDDDAVQAGAR